MNKKFVGVFLAAMVFSSVWVVRADEPAVRVASLSTILSDLASEVGGDRVEVVNILRPGADPHSFEPTVRDVRRMSDARIILANGLGFEPYLQRLRGSVGGEVEFVVIGDSIKPLMIDADDHDHDHGHSHSHSHAGDGGQVADPHWWQSVANAKIAVGVIRDALIGVDPEGRAEYKSNAAAYLKRLNELERWVRVEVGALPRDRRVLVTSHDALGYFANEFDFTVLPVSGISTRDQPSSKHVRELIETIRGKGVTAIFAENIENPKVLQEITRETGARLGGELYTDSLGKKEANTYESMIRHNVTTIVSALR